MPSFPAGRVVFGMGGTEVAASALSAFLHGAVGPWVQLPNEHRVQIVSALLNFCFSADLGGGDMDLKKIRTLYVSRGIL